MVPRQCLAEDGNLRFSEAFEPSKFCSVQDENNINIRTRIRESGPVLSFLLVASFRVHFGKYEVLNILKSV